MQSAPRRGKEDGEEEMSSADRPLGASEDVG